MAVSKVNWHQVGHVTEPGRYMFRFGWLTVAADDLAVWERFPNAIFALVKTAAATPIDSDAIDSDAVEEFHLGAFELPEKSTLSEQR